MSDLKQQAEALGIKIDGRWSDERVLKEIDAFVAARNAGVAPVEQIEAPTHGLIPVRVLRDFWDAEGERFRKGRVIEVPVETALDGVESGALSRVKG